MIQIAFESAFDPFHTAFRVFQHAAFAALPLPVERWRILDVYLSEPVRVLQIRVPPNLKASAKKAAACQEPVYGRRPSNHSMFTRMRPVQEAALQTLVQEGFLSPEAFQEELIDVTQRPTEGALAERLRDANARAESLLTFLHRDLDRFALDGLNGLKDRTRLGEFRYDVV